jgi:hypothetical protein
MAHTVACAISQKAYTNLLLVVEQFAGWIERGAKTDGICRPR